MIKVLDEHLGRKINYSSYEEKVKEINKMIEDKSGPGNDYLGWLNYPSSIKDEDLNELVKHAEYVRKNYVKKFLISFINGFIKKINSFLSGKY